MRREYIDTKDGWCSVEHRINTGTILIPYENYRWFRWYRNNHRTST